jgi:hypothetical protein
MQEILTKCPTDRFCKLPGGEICVFGLPDAPRMTQITATEWRSLVPTGRTEALQPQVIFSGEVLFSGSVGILAGAVIGITISRLNSHRRH